MPITAEQVTFTCDVCKQRKPIEAFADGEIESNTGDWFCGPCHAKQERVRQAICRAHEAFFAEKKQLEDLSPRFWVALMDLKAAADRKIGGSDLLQALKAAYKHLGAPGDFGYGTPPGEALKALYDRWRELAESKSATREVSDG